jgi:hypothetical protein
MGNTILSEIGGEDKKSSASFSIKETKTKILRGTTLIGVQQRPLK